MKFVRKIKRQLACIISVLLLLSLSSCGTKEAEAPNLLEPLSGTESYREVAYGDVGMMKIVYGTIVPTEHAMFWDTLVNVDQLFVDVGDYVEKGAVIASADLETARETKQELEAARTFLVRKQELMVKKQELLIKKLQLKQEGLAQLGDTEGAAAVEIEIATEQENANYDNLLYQHQLSDYDEQIQKQQQIIEDGTLVATASGYVSYVKELKNGNGVTTAENVVVIADYENTYIKVEDVTIADKLLEKYNQYYTIKDGKKVPLREYAYSAQECLTAENQLKYPSLRMQYEDMKQQGEVGTVIPIYLIKERAENVLYVGNDSIYEDDQGYFVYCKKGEQRVQTYIETGISDASNTEVLSGLSEGDKVYYTTDTAWPDAYEEYTVGPAGAYETMYETSRYTIQDASRRYYSFAQEGIVEDVCVNMGETVEKGNPVLKIRINEGSAKLEELRMNLDGIKEGHDQQTKAYETAIQSLQNEKRKVEAETPVQTATGTDALAATESDAEEAVNPKQADMLGVDIEIETLNYTIQTLEYEYQYGLAEKEYEKTSHNNNGSGIISVCAEESGTVEDMWIWEGLKISENQIVFAIDTQITAKVALYGGKSAPVPGTKVTLKNEETQKEIKGMICGSSGELEVGKNSYYLTTIGNKVYITQSLTQDTTMYYVKLEDGGSIEEIVGQQTISYPTASFSDVYTIPADALYSEKPATENGLVRYYVWKLVDGNMEKQYVDACIYNETQDLSNYDSGGTIACILNGIAEGDVLAVPVELTDTE